MGDSNTLLEQVNSFYEYWIHFESWRDFSAQAADELQVENELENAESRFEKRWIQKEIDRRARQLKRTEMARIQTLVERAMEADPRLRWHRQSLIQAREQAAADRLRAKEEELQAAEEAAQHAEALLVHEQELRAAEKIQRDLEKKRLRKARQTLRKMTSSSFESYTTETTTNGSNGVVGDDSEGVGGGEANGTSGSRSSNCGKANKNSNNENQKDSNIHGSPPPPLWNDAYDLSQDVEFLCTSLSLDELNQLNEDFERINNAKGLSLIHQLTLERKAQEQLQQKQQSQSQRVSPVDSDSNNKPAPWTALELSALAKAVKKYPAGGASRWDAIALLVNSMCRPDVPRTREACIEKFNQIIRSSSSAKNSTVSAAAAVAAQNAATIAAPLDKTTIDPCESVSASTSSNGFSSKSTTLLDVATTEDSATACKDAVLDDTMETKWTPKQDQQLQEALSKFPNSMEKNERWTSIAAVVSGQTKKACVQRFKAIRETLLKQKSGPSI